MSVRITLPSAPADEDLTYYQLERGNLYHVVASKNPSEQGEYVMKMFEGGLIWLSTQTVSSEEGDSISYWAEHDLRFRKAEPGATFSITQE